MANKFCSKCGDKKPDFSGPVCDACEFAAVRPTGPVVSYKEPRSKDGVKRKSRSRNIRFDGAVFEEIDSLADDLGISFGSVLRIIWKRYGAEFKKSTIAANNAKRD